MRNTLCPVERRPAHRAFSTIERRARPRDQRIAFHAIDRQIRTARKRAAFNFESR